MNLEGWRTKLAEFSEALPEWLIIYDTAKSYSKTNRLPPAVFKAGEASYFIGK
jgi:ABC-type antimicrobial peptide transport system permease subunit